jgi:phosphatidylserine/phosphatidylglycerophosphate/cardiolipin synthase-like enzyme
MLWSSVALADDVELVLHDPTGRGAPADACDAPICASLLRLIEGARGSIGFAFYGFREQTALLEAMKAAEARGVEVRGVVDRDVTGATYYESTDAWIAALGPMGSDLEVDRATAAHQRTWVGRDRCPRPAGAQGPLQCSAFTVGDRCALLAEASADPIEFRGDIMHDKFVVVDHRYVWTGSANASDSCTGGYNANAAVVVDSPIVARWYESELAQMEAGRFHRAKEAQAPMRAILGPDLALEVQFSPQHHPIERAVLPAIRAATRSIDVAVFFLTHTGIAQALIDAAQRGVKVRVLLDATGAANEYSKHPVLRAAGIPVKVEDLGGKMHAKSAVIDGEVVIAGSMNWTGAGDEDNDENTLILRSHRLASEYQAWFDRLWAEIPDRWLTARPDPESRDSGTACSDGVDNDFDGKVDREDPGCGPAPPTPADPPIRWEPRRDDGRCAWPANG